MIVVDNLIPASLQDTIESILLGNSFSWYLQDDITYIGGADKAPAFSHIYKPVNNPPSSPLFDLVSLIAHVGAEQYGFTFNEILQARSFLQLPLSRSLLTNEVDVLHIDSAIPHLVVLYYVCDSDGDTIVVDKRYDPKEGVVIDQRYFEHKVLKKVTPKKGRALIFDGAHYHTAEQPKDNIRCIINFNIV